MKKDQQQISYATSKKQIYKLKIVFVGDQYVGKTSIINRFINNSFDNQGNTTIGIDFVSKNITLGNSMVRLQLWDTAGQQRFRSLIPNYIRNCRAALIIYDVTNQQSYQNIQKWIDFVKQSSGDEVMLIVVGNKLDLIQDRKINYVTASNKIQTLGYKYFEVSAKSGQNIQKIFQQICTQLTHTKQQKNFLNDSTSNKSTHTNPLKKQQQVINKQNIQIKINKKKQINNQQFIINSNNKSKNYKQQQCC